MAHGGFFGLEFFGLCRSKAVEDPYRVSFVKLLAGLHKFERLGYDSSRDYSGAWRHVKALLLMTFLGFAHQEPLDQVVIPFP